ncbi:2OG-Fe(II) oxygenase [Glaciecola sp. 2405UD65-10]|uniref:2OG-Fe(II) oxygenase n=1 Tax=Glaciecola sp. 2405UD65-10 TaxID=3397244 RepID=UPI003B5C13CD
MSINKLQQARDLELPTRQAMLERDASVQAFWDHNNNILSEAWSQWETSEQEKLPLLSNALLDDRLRDAVMQAWEDPSKESVVKDLWKEVAPNVYECQFFNPEKLTAFRDYLEQVWDAQIPLRPPYGIVLNRRGAMLDPRSQGYLAAPSFQRFYQELLTTYMRPIARLLFPEIVGYDTQSFGFSIQYKPGTDTSIRPHTDASAVTLNININPQHEKFEGSALNFYDSRMNLTSELSFKPGTAMIHRGNVPHAAQPITGGERSNIVLWLYGDYGRIPQRNTMAPPTDARERWSVPSSAPDGFAPF